MNKAQEWTGFTRQGAYKVIRRFVDLDILQHNDENKTYGHLYLSSVCRYLKINFHIEIQCQLLKNTMIV